MFYPDQISKALIRICLAADFRQAAEDGISPRPPIQAFINMKDGFNAELIGEEAVKFWSELNSDFITYEKIGRLTLDTHAVNLSGITTAVFLSQKQTIAFDRKGEIIENIPYSRSDFLTLAETRGYGVKNLINGNKRLASISRLSVPGFDKRN